MSVILRLKEMPKSCIDCPFEYDCMSCCTIEGEESKFETALENGISPWHTRLPNCPLEEKQGEK